MYSIHGMECDYVADESSRWPSIDPDFGVVDFFHRSETYGHEQSDSPFRYLVTLPGGSGCGRTFEEALHEAKEDQHAAIWGEA